MQMLVLLTRTGVAGFSVRKATKELVHRTRMHGNASRRRRAASTNHVCVYAC